jgi:hypothetical protein
MYSGKARKAHARKAAQLEFDLSLIDDHLNDEPPDSFDGRFIRIVHDSQRLAEPASTLIRTDPDHRRRYDCTDDTRPARPARVVATRPSPAAISSGPESHASRTHVQIDFDFGDEERVASANRDDFPKPYCYPPTSSRFQWKKFVVGIALGSVLGALLLAMLGVI